MGVGGSNTQRSRWRFVRKRKRKKKKKKRLPPYLQHAPEAAPNASPLALPAATWLGVLARLWYVQRRVAQEEVPRPQQQAHELGRA